MGNYLKKPIIDEAVQSGRLGNVNYASNTIQVSNSEFGLIWARVRSKLDFGIIGLLEIKSLSHGN